MFLLGRLGDGRPAAQLLFWTISACRRQDFTVFRHGNDDFPVGMLVCNRYITVAVMAI